MKKTPYIQFYVRNYLNNSNIKRLSLASQGLYVRILLCLWLESEPYLPMDEKLISRIVGVPEQEFLPLWKELWQDECNFFILSHNGSMFTHEGFKNGTL